MPLMIYHDTPLVAHLSLHALAQVVSPTQITNALDATTARERRTRKLPASFMLLFCVAIHLCAADPLTHVYACLVHAVRWLLPDPAAARVSKSALCQARYRLGARPVVALFHQLCQPLATPQTPDAFLCGLRLWALDSTTFDLPDTPANARVFGRPTNARGSGAWPQAQLIALSECATHAVCDAGVWRGTADAHAGGMRLLRSLGVGDLVLWDCGFHAFAMVTATRRRRVHFLARLPASVKPTLGRTLADGSQLVALRHPRQRRHIVWVRLIRYTLGDPVSGAAGSEQRLITSLLNPRRAPAEALVLAYHARWEFELTVDELKTHQRPDRPLRSEKPVGVIQELYGLLIAHYVVRAVMSEAAQTVALPPTRLSFLTALRVIRAVVPVLQRTPPDQVPRLYRQLLADIVAVPLPPRAHRREPRVVKQQQSPYAVKRPHHSHWPQPTKSFREMIRLLN